MPSMFNQVLRRSHLGRPSRGADGVTGEGANARSSGFVSHTSPTPLDRPFHPH
jgi:hypothetical protein